MGGVITISRTTAWKTKKKKKNRKMEAAAERRQSASTDGCLLSSNYTDEGSFSHLQLRLSAGEAVQGGFTLLIDKWTELNKQKARGHAGQPFIGQKKPYRQMSCVFTTEQNTTTTEIYRTKVKKHYQDGLRLMIQFMLEVKSRVHDVHLNERFKSIKASEYVSGSLRWI